MKTSYIINVIEKFARLTEKKRGFVAIPAEDERNLSKKDKFPLNKPSEAKMAYIRLHELNEIPTWWDGTLDDLKESILNKIRSKYDIIEKGGRIFVKTKL